MYKFVKNNLEKINIFNVVLAVLAIVFTSRKLFAADALVTDKITAAAFIIALTSGLLYIACSYKKNANGYYKGFMIIYALLSVYNIVSKLYHELAVGMNVSLIIITTVCVTVGAVCIVLLAFVKNLGVSKSLKLAAVNFWVSIGSAVIGMIFTKGFVASPQIWLSTIIIAALAFVFVSAKYADKEARGAK